MEKCGYRCQKCKAVDRMDKDITIFRFPKVLVVHLKRFSRRQKISTTINIPHKLNMTPYAPYSNHQDKDLAKRYRLYGMSKHSGSLNGGHYVGEAKNIDDQ